MQPYKNRNGATSVLYIFNQSIFSSELESLLVSTSFGISFRGRQALNCRIYHRHSYHFVSYTRVQHPLNLNLGQHLRETTEGYKGFAFECPRRVCGHVGMEFVLWCRHVIAGILYYFSLA